MDASIGEPISKTTREVESQAKHLNISDNDEPSTEPSQAPKKSLLSKLVEKQVEQQNEVKAEVLYRI